MGILKVLLSLRFFNLNFVRARNSFYRALELTSNTKFQRNLLNGMEYEDFQAEYKDECTKNVICFIVL